MSETSFMFNFYPGLASFVKTSLTGITGTLNFLLQCNLTTVTPVTVLPFSIQLRPGRAVFDQLVQAFHEALVSGQLRDGDSFPSVRALSRELKISPTTAHRVVSHLKDRGFLISQPGIGMLVTAPDLPERDERLKILEPELKKIIAQSRDLSLSEKDLTELLNRLWKET